MMIFASLRVYEPTASWDHEQGAFRFAAVSVSVDLGSDQLRDKMKPHGVEGGDRVDSDHSTNTDEVIKLTKSVPVLGKLAKDVPGSARSAALKPGLPGSTFNHCRAFTPSYASGVVGLYLYQ